MKPTNSEVEKKLKEIIGDSEGKEAMSKIYEWLQENTRYRYYTVPPRCGKTAISQLEKEKERRRKQNCSDRNNR